MQGYLLIDAAAHRLARIDGTLFRDVTFGWGIIGHLDKGGHFRVQQADCRRWILGNHLHEPEDDGKILLFQALSITIDEVFSDFQPFPRTCPLRKRVELLESGSRKNSRTNVNSAERLSRAAAYDQREAP